MGYSFLSIKLGVCYHIWAKLFKKYHYKFGAFKYRQSSLFAVFDYLQIDTKTSNNGGKLFFKPKLALFVLISAFPVRERDLTNSEVKLYRTEKIPGVPGIVTFKHKNIEPLIF
jgi:hypothetical protein